MHDILIMGQINLCSQTHTYILQQLFIEALHDFPFKWNKQSLVSTAYRHSGSNENCLKKGVACHCERCTNLSSVLSYTRANTASVCRCVSKTPFFRKPKSMYSEVWGVFLALNFKYSFCFQCGSLIKIDSLLSLSLRLSHVEVISNYWHFWHCYLAAVAFYQFNFCFWLIQYYPIASKWKWFLFKLRKKPTLNCCRILFQIDCVRCPAYS